MSIEKVMIMQEHMKLKLQGRLEGFERSKVGNTAPPPLIPPEPSDFLTSKILKIKRNYIKKNALGVV